MRLEPLLTTRLGPGTLLHRLVSPADPDPALDAGGRGQSRHPLLAELEYIETSQIDFLDRAFAGVLLLIYVLPDAPHGAAVSVEDQHGVLAPGQLLVVRAGLGVHHCVSAVQRLQDTQVVRLTLPLTADFEVGPGAWVASTVTAATQQGVVVGEWFGNDEAAALASGAVEGALRICDVRLGSDQRLSLDVPAGCAAVVVSLAGAGLINDRELAALSVASLPSDPVILRAGALDWRCLVVIATPPTRPWQREGPFCFSSAEHHRQMLALERRRRALPSPVARSAATWRPLDHSGS